MTPEADFAHWTLTLYVSGLTPLSTAAIAAVRRMCEEEFEGMADLEIVDVHDRPALLVADRIVAVPTLVKRLPRPFRRIVGDMSHIGRVRVGLDLKPTPSESPPA